MRRLLGVLIAVIALWMGLVGPGPVAASPTLPTSAHTYDASDYSAQFEHGVSNRGPPANRFKAPLKSTGDLWSPGALTRSPMAATAINYAYNGLARLSHKGSLGARPGVAAGSTAQGHARVLDPDLLSLPGWHVAAETAAKACSFSGATAVLMADGTKKPIEDIKVGDKVIATDPETGKRVTRRVTRVWVHDDQLLDLIIDGDVITTTEDHLFWSVTDRRFERADRLVAGEVVLGDDRRQIAVSGFRLGKERTTLAYNLSIAGVHTYHVGEEAVLVHNECSDVAYQGVRHIRDEIAREGKNGSHSWAARMSDDELGSYLDGFITRGGGQRLDDGALGWYDPDRGIAIIQRSEYSMTGYSMPYSDFLGRLAN